MGNRNHRNNERLTVAIALLACATRAFATTDVEPCKGLKEYSERAHQLIQEAQKSPIELLIIMYSSLGQSQEVAVGLVTEKDGRHLVQYEFQPSLFYNSYKEVTPREKVLDFKSTSVHVDLISRPVSIKLAQEMIRTLNLIRVQATPKGSETITLEDGTVVTVITTDGYTHELTLTDGRCVQVTGPPRGPPSAAIIAFNRFLADGLVSWSQAASREFEAQAIRLLNSINPEK